MTRWLRPFLAACLAALSGVALAQGTLQQGGGFTAGRAPMYLQSGTSQPFVGDSGPASGGAVGTGLKELGITARGTGTPPYVAQGTGPNGELVCLFDAPTNNATGGHSLCLSPNAQGGGLISYQAFGSATVLPLNFLINGVLTPFTGGGGGGSGNVTGPGSSTVDHFACWNNTAGTLLKDCNPYTSLNTWTLAQTFSGGGSFAGIVTAPTQSPGDNTTRLATTAFVAAAVTANTPTLTQNNVFMGNASAQATAAAVGGDCTASLITGTATWICTKSNGTSFGSMAFQLSSAVTITGGSITGMPSPTLASDVATKAYADAISGGFHVIPGLPSARLATAAVLPNTPTYANGASGVGATLTAGANSTITVDGTVAALSDVVVVNTQASALQNGIYTVTTAGDGSTPWVLTRSTSFDSAAEMTVGSLISVTAGSTNSGRTFALAATTTTVGTTAVNFNLYSSSTLQWTAGTGSDIYRASGNVGIATAPNAGWGPTSYRVLQINNDAIGSGNTGAALTVFQNLYYDDTNFKYAITAAAALQVIDAGAFAWYTVPGGTAGTNATITERMRLTNTGKVGIATGAPSAQFDVAGYIRSTNTTNVATTGAGTEITYDSGGGQGYVFAVDRGTAVYKPLNISGSTLTLNATTGGKTSFALGGLEGVNTNPTLLANNPAFVPPGGNLVRTSFGVNAIYNAGANTTLDGNLGYSAVLSTTVTADAVLAASAGAAQANLYSNKAGWTEQAALLVTYGSDSAVTGGGGAGVWTLARQGVGSGDGNNYTHGIRISSETDGGVHPGVGATVTASASNNAYRIGFQATAVTTYGFLVGSDGVNTAGTGDPTTPFAYVSRLTGTPLFFVDNGGGTHATSFPVISDRRTKDDIQPLKLSALERIAKLKPVTYVSKYTPAFRSAHFIAQDVIGVIPEAIRYSNDNYALDDSAILAYVVKALQELKADNDNLRVEMRRRAEKRAAPRGANR